MLHLFHRASQVAEETFHAGDASGMTCRQYILLSAIAAHSGSSQTAFGRATGIDRSTLADIVRRLVKQGLVARRRTKEDTRAYAVTLTQKGKEALAEAIPRAAKVDAVLLEMLKPKERPQFLKSLQCIAEGQRTGWR